MKISGRAYSGKKIQVGNYWLPVVIDLAGLEIPASFPLLSAHRNTPETRIGLASGKIENGVVLFSGDLYENDASKPIRMNKDGWQSSVGVDVISAARVYDNEEGKKVIMEINGQKHEAPFVWIKQGKLRENSILPLGADDDTFVNIQAGREGEEETITGLTIRCESLTFSTEKTMDEKEKIEEKPKETPQIDEKIKAAREEAIAQERARSQDIEKLSAGMENRISNLSTLKAQAIAEGWTGDQFSRNLIVALQASRPQELPVPAVSVKNPLTISEIQKTITASFCAQSGVYSEERLLKEFGEKVVEASYERPFSLQGAFREACRAEGVHLDVSSFGSDHVRAGFATVSLPGILNNVANKATLAALERMPSLAVELCTEGSTNNFKEIEKYRLSLMGDAKPVGPDGELKSFTLGEEKATNQLHTFGGILTLTYQMIKNDDLGEFLRLFTEMGNLMYEYREELVFTRLLSNPTMEDAVALFEATTHKNYITGADTTFSDESLKRLYALMTNQTNKNGKPVTVLPKYVVVPSGYLWAAIELTKSMRKTTSGQDFLTGEVHTNPELNAASMFGLQPRSSAYLENSKITGYSSTAWYLFADPRQTPTIEIIYLDGRKRPVIETAPVAPNVLGQNYRAYWNIGAREQEYRGMAKALGA